MMQQIPSWLASAAVIVGALVIALTAHALIYRVLSRIASVERAPVFGRVIRSGRAPLRVSVALATLLMVMPVAGLPPEIEQTAVRVFGVVLVGSLGWTLTVKIGTLFGTYLAMGPQVGEEDLEVRRRRTQLTVFRQLTMFTLAVITVGIMLTAIPAVRNVGFSLFASAGVAGIVVGVAARPTIANLIAGIQIALTQPVRIGDVVIVEGEWGHVEAIYATYVVVEIWDERRLVLPITYFLERPFQNWTRDSPRILGTVFVYVDYSVPVTALRNRLHEILCATPLWDGRVWNLQVTDLKERTMELRALVSSANAGRSWDLRCHVREQMIAYINQAFPGSLPCARLDLRRDGDGAGAAATAKAVDVTRTGAGVS